MSSSSSGVWHVLVAEQRPCDCSPSGPSLPSWGLRTISLMVHNLSVSPVNLCVQMHSCNQPCKTVCKNLSSPPASGAPWEAVGGGGIRGEWTAMGLPWQCLFTDLTTPLLLTPLSNSVNTHGGKACQQAHENYVAGVGNAKSTTVHLLFPPIATLEHGWKTLASKIAISGLMTGTGCLLSKALHL